MKTLLEEAEKAAFWKFVSRLFPENEARSKLPHSLDFHLKELWEASGGHLRLGALPRVGTYTLLAFLVVYLGLPSRLGLRVHRPLTRRPRYDAARGGAARSGSVVGLPGGRDVAPLRGRSRPGGVPATPLRAY